MMEASSRLSQFLRRPSGIVILIGCYLLLGYVAVLLVDVWELWGIKTWIGERFRHSLLWWLIFMEKGPTEFLQYGLLASVAVLGSMLSARLQVAGQTDAARFWLLIAIAGAVLSIEDATSYRYILTDYMRGFFDEKHATAVRLATEGVYYGAIAAIPVYAFLRYWRIAWNGPSRWWLIAGYAAYGAAALASVTRYVGFWYQALGDRIVDWSDGRLGDGFVPYSAGDPGAGNWFMDLLVEESLEVLAASLLVASVLAYLRYHNQEQTSKGPGGPGRPEPPVSKDPPSSPKDEDPGEDQGP